jgi:hypothetical protein
MGSNLPVPVLNSEIESVSIDEMWHFINKKNGNYYDISITAETSYGNTVKI